MPCGKSKIWDAGEVSEMAAKDEISAAWQRIMRLINEQNGKRMEKNEKNGKKNERKTKKKWKKNGKNAETHGGFNGPRLRDDFENFAILAKFSSCKIL